MTRTWSNIKPIPVHQLHKYSLMVCSNLDTFSIKG